MRSPRWPKRRLVTLVGAVVSLGFFVPSVFCSQREKARRQYELAQRLYAEIESRPLSKRTIPRYRKVSQAFQQVYTLDPAYQKTPAALGSTASLYEEMGRQFNDSRYYVAAIKAYQFLISQYPQSASSRDAMFAIGEIYHSDLNQPQQALDAFRRFLQRYPQGRKAAAAQQDIKEIQRTLARRTKQRRQPELAASSAKERDSSDDEDLEADQSSEKDQPDANTRELVRMTGVRCWVGPSYTRIVIGMEDQVRFSASRLRHPDRLVFDFTDTRLSPELVGKTFPVEGGFLREVRVAQFRPSVTRAVLDVDKIDNYSVFSLPNPFRVIIDIHGTPVGTEQVAVSRTTRTTARLQVEEGSGQLGADASSSIASGSIASGSTQADASDGSGKITDRARHTARSRTPNSPSADVVSKQASVKSSGFEGDLSRSTSGTGTILQSRSGATVPQGRTTVASNGDHAIRPSDPTSAPVLTSNARSSASANTSKRIRTDEPEFTYRPRTSIESRSSAVAGDRDSELQPTRAAARPGTLTRALGLKIGRIVIDPGHGGHDTGTIGPNGLREKDIVLDVGLRLRKLIQEKLGADVVMTRRDDTFIPLEERTAIANQRAADLFVSIHANASRDEGARGIETYYLSLTSNPQALEVAARENATSEESVHQLQSLIKKIALTEKMKESEDFAQQVQREVCSRLQKAGGGQENRGVKRAPFVVLIGANMPSVLAEISFLTNPRDEKLLRKPDYRQKIAEALYHGVLRYSEGLTGLNIAQRSRPPLMNRVPASDLESSENRAASAP